MYVKFVSISHSMLIDLSRTSLQGIVCKPTIGSDELLEVITGSVLASPAAYELDVFQLVFDDVNG